MERIFSHVAAVAVVLSVALAPPWAAAQAEKKPLTPDEAAAVLLDSARRAYNEGKFDFAVGRFQEFLKTYGNHRDAPAANYGLGLALLYKPGPDYRAALAALDQAAGRGDFPDHPWALYYGGSALRCAAQQALAEAEAKPQQAQQFQNQARASFEQAMARFSGAAGLIAERLKKPGEHKPPGTLSDNDWLARAQCDQCEMLLRLGKTKEAGDLAAKILSANETRQSQFRYLAAYHQGYALLAQKDYVAAGRALSSLSPFTQEFGPHARYLLARVHHLVEDRPEAAGHYRAAVATFAEARKQAQAAMQMVQKVPGSLAPEQRAYLAALAEEPSPEWVIRSAFYGAVLQAEGGRFEDAVKDFASLAEQYPKSPLAGQAQLRQGFCQLQLKDHAAAIKTLEPLTKDPALGDQAIWWRARAQVGSADPADAKAYGQVLNSAVQDLRRAADLAGRLGASDPEAKVRRGDILMEMADMLQLAGRYPEAAAACQQVRTEKNNPDRLEEALQRQIAALHLAGKYAESDALCAEFERTYPKSTLLSAVLFRKAENAFLSAMAAARDRNPDIQRRAPAMLDEAITRYQRLLKDYPDFRYANLARQAMGTAYYEQGKYAEGIPVLQAIAEPDRSGDLAGVPYLLADCLIRSLPDRTDDALAAGRLIDQASRAAKLLEGFAGAQAKDDPQVADALLKLGYCHQRVGELLIDKEPRTEALTQARAAYERLMQQFPKDERAVMARFERAKVLALLGDAGNARKELQQFASGPLLGSAVAPLAMIRYCSLTRSLGAAADAAKQLQQFRAQREAQLLRDPATAQWVPLLQYEHALAIKESGKPTDARVIFEAIAKQFAGRPEAAEATWRAAQCRWEELAAGLAKAREDLRKGGKPEQVQAAEKAVGDQLAALRQMAGQFAQQAGQLKGSAAGSDAHLRMLYESAWAWRVLADEEVEAARRKLQEDAVRKIKLLVAKQSPGAEVDLPAAPEILLRDIPLQPAEKAARAQYEALIAGAATRRTPSGDPDLATLARYELAELLADRGDHDKAVELLVEALENASSADLADRIRLRLASSFLAKSFAGTALALIRDLPKDLPAPLAAETRYLTGAAYVQRQEWAKAIEQLQPFRDQGPYQNLPGLADRALLQLGLAFAGAGNLGESYRSYETLVGRFRDSEWVPQARYGLGEAMRLQKQYDPAVNHYLDVTRRTTAEVAARAQMQIGLCRMEQKRYEEAAQALLAVPYTYDYPHLSAQAWCEAARAYVELKKPEEAAELWQRVIRDHPGTSWAQTARQNLAKVK